MNDARTNWKSDGERKCPAFVETFVELSAFVLSRKNDHQVDLPVRAIIGVTLDHRLPCCSTELMAHSVLLSLVSGPFLTAVNSLKMASLVKKPFVFYVNVYSMYILHCTKTTQEFPLHKALKSQNACNLSAHRCLSN